MNDTNDIKRLRILTGAHAGATLDLVAGHHSIGASPDCDIALSDWTTGRLDLQVSPDGRVRAQADDPSAIHSRFDDCVPVDFGGVALCVGPIAGAWPTDAAMLANLRAPSQADLRGMPRRALSGDRRALSLLSVFVIALVSFGSVVTAVSKARDDPHMTPADAIAAEQHHLDAIAPGRLTVAAHDGGLTIDGTVDTPAQRQAVVATFARVLPGQRIQQHIAIASELAESIRSSLNLPNAHVTYRGHGVYALDAEVANLPEAQASTDRVAADLAPAVRYIEATFHEPVAEAALPALRSAMSAEGVSVMETPDGIKHMVITSATDLDTALADNPPAAGSPASPTPPEQRAKP